MTTPPPMACLLPLRIPWCTPGWEGGREWGNLSCDLQASLVSSPGREAGQRPGWPGSRFPLQKVCVCVCVCVIAAQLGLQESRDSPPDLSEDPLLPSPQRTPPKRGLGLSRAEAAGRKRRIQENKNPSRKVSLGLWIDGPVWGHPLGTVKKVKMAAMKLQLKLCCDTFPKTRLGFFAATTRNSQAGEGGVPPMEPRQRSRGSPTQPQPPRSCAQAGAEGGGGQLPAFPAGGHIRGESGPGVLRLVGRRRPVGQRPSEGRGQRRPARPALLPRYLRRRRGRE